MKVVILCGGKGTRIREETEFRPKPMMPIGNYPILWHIMKIYSCFNYKEFILCLGYKGEMIKEFFRNYQWHTRDVALRIGTNIGVTFLNGENDEDWDITLANTGENSMTAYRVRMIKKYLDRDQDFMLTYGDGVGNIDIPELLKYHKKAGKVCTLTGVHPPGRFGELSIGKSGDAVAFNEKPQAEGGYINGGFMVCNKRIFDYLPDDSAVMLESIPMKRLAQDRELAVFKHEGFWQPMDTYPEFSLLNRLWDSGKAPWKTWG